MIKNFFLFLLSIWIIIPELSGQKEVTGTVYSGQDGEPLKGIFVRLGNRNTKTDDEGTFTLPYTAKEDLELGASGFHDMRIKAEEVEAWNRLDIYLALKPEVEGLGINENIEAIYTPEFEYIFDYEFLQDNLITATYFNKKLNKQKRNPGYENCVLTLFDKGVKKHRLIIPDYPYRLRSSPYGDLYLEGVDYSKRIVIKEGELIDIDINFEDYLNQILPLTVAIDSSVFWVKIIPELPQVVHYVYSISAGREMVTRVVRNKEYFLRTRGDYTMLSKNQRSKAQELAEEKGFSPQLYSTYLRRNELVVNLIQPYSPAFGKGKEVIILDPLNRRIFSHDKYGLPIDSVYFDPEPGDEKLRSFTQDQVSKKIYQILDKGGVTIIRHVDETTGGLGAPFKIGYPFVEKIKVYNGFVYYIRRDVDKGTRHLYRERLNFLR